METPQSIQPIPTRPLGKTGCRVTQLGLGGEGVLRTHGRAREAAAVITRALDLGIRYCDTAPAYSSSMDYYGAVLGERRREIFLASKTADRTRDGSLRILDDSLKRLHTDALDLWQLHDLRTLDEVETVFSRRGAIQALMEARAAKRVRFLGITGHHDPEVLMEMMRRFDFDTVLVALNAADAHRNPFCRTVLPEAARRGLGVIAMKVFAAGELVRPRGPLSPAEAMSYPLSLEGVSLAIIGCRTPAEVEENVRNAQAFRSLLPESMRALEEKVRPEEAHFTSYKIS